MMEKSQKERLEQELRFLKESLDADVISKEEYEKGNIKRSEALWLIEDLRQTRQRHVLTNVFCASLSRSLRRLEKRGLGM